MRLGSTGEPFMWWISHPAKCGPLTSQFWRLPSDVRINAPLRVPTRTRTLLMYRSFHIELASRTLVLCHDYILFFHRPITRSSGPGKSENHPFSALFPG